MEQTSDMGFAKVDLDRQRRCGFPEVIYAEGKTVEAVVSIFERQQRCGIVPFATRVKPEQMEALKDRFPNGIANDLARTFRMPPNRKPDLGKVAVLTAGTSDQPVAEEAVETLLWMGVEVVLIHDVGVAGPHRLVENLPQMEGCAAAVVIAGMEGALPSVVGGYVDFPVVAVPTSVGYGANFGGISALLGMLNSCASNVTVVNIDAGFKGGYVAGLIAKNQRK
ncbi:MAG: nickel pincer cofactor biosynthesis protein LarB [Planctomycetia bacterium]|nr:nickel pincer cofactor biosynthesis protein LarB [Planctomycetia bacterium]